MAYETILILFAVVVYLVNKGFTVAQVVNAGRPLLLSLPV